MEMRHITESQCSLISLIARFKGPIWDPSGADRSQVGPMLAPWTLLSEMCLRCRVVWRPARLCRGSTVNTVKHIGIIDLNRNYVSTTTRLNTSFYHTHTGRAKSFWNYIRLNTSQMSYSVYWYKKQHYNGIALHRYEPQFWPQWNSMITNQQIT